MRSVALVNRYGREMGSVYDLLGTHEPALTAAPGWTIARSPTLMGLVLDRFLPVEYDDEAISEYMADCGFGAYLDEDE